MCVCGRHLSLSISLIFSHINIEGDLYEDGLALKNGFFRSRKFMGNSEGSLDLFAEERREESGGEEGGGEEENTQMEAMRRKDRLEREEFIKKCRVSIELYLAIIVFLTMLYGYALSLNIALGTN